jgi:hypothetical protein
MILIKLENSPEKKIPIAMAMIVVGLSMTVIGINWSRFASSVPHPGTDWDDFLRGAIFGVAIVLEIAGVAIAASAAAAKKRQAQ